MQVCMYASLQVCKYASMQVCKYTNKSEAIYMSAVAAFLYINGGGMSVGNFLIVIVDNFFN